MFHTINDGSHETKVFYTDRIVQTEEKTNKHLHVSYKSNIRFYVFALDRETRVQKRAAKYYCIVYAFAIIV